MTCPGVWLCQSGPVKLMIRSLGHTFYTCSVRPRFPLIFHELFTIEGYFKDVHSANDLRQKLIGEPIDLSIYQNGHRIAYFRESLASLLTHQRCKNVLDLELLMSTTKCFPGILSPKVETQIEFTVSKYNPLNDCVHATSTSGRRESVGICWGNSSGGGGANKQQQHGYNHAKLDERQRSQEAPQQMKRQRPVCHQTNIHINNENPANFIPVNVIARKTSESNNNSIEGSYHGGQHSTTTGAANTGVHFTVA